MQLVLLLLVAAVAAQPLTLEPYTLRVFDGAQTAADLGRLQVAPGIQIAFLRLRARTERSGPPILFLMGGAGRGIVMGQVPPFYRLFDRLRDVADVLLLDQRGIGMSVPDLESVCSAGPPAPPDALSTPARLLDAQLAAIRRCVDQISARSIDLGAFTVGNRANDIEQLRRALGAERVSLLAWSAGTETALETMRRFGDRIASAVLAGAVGPDDILSLPSTADLLLRRISPALFETARALAEKLDRQPMKMTAGDREILVGKPALQAAIQADLSDGRALPSLPVWLPALAKGDPQAFQRKAEGMYNGLRSASVLGLALGCDRGWPPGRLERVRREARLSVAGSDGSPLPQACAMLKLPRDAAQDQPMFSAARTLFVTGTLDAATPPHQAEQIRLGFPNSSHLIVTNGTHDSIAHPAVQSAIVSFFKGEDAGRSTLELPSPFR
ncbi:MAG TPA: alpha/beta fold hydrolase [Candidatus Solibacter sp.]|nr:alpha/beta fold hydrolase [Candidatus Solibacter sp.]